MDPIIQDVEDIVNDTAQDFILRLNKDLHKGMFYISQHVQHNC